MTRTDRNTIEKLQNELGLDGWFMVAKRLSAPRQTEFGMTVGLDQLVHSQTPEEQRAEFIKHANDVLDEREQRGINVFDHFDVPMEPDSEDGKDTIAKMNHYIRTGELPPPDTKRADDEARDKFFKEQSVCWGGTAEGLTTIRYWFNAGWELRGRHDNETA